jgi:hypothetical protein
LQEEDERSQLMSEYDWKQEVRQWVDKCRHATPDLADKLIRFFELAFAGTRYPEETWFGVHGSTVSLVVGGIFLAAVVSSGDDRGLWLLVDEKLQPIEGIDYRPVKSTQDC